MSSAYEGSQKSAGNTSRFGDILFFTILCLGAVSMLLPLFWMVSASLKSGDVIYTSPPQWFPREFVWSNFPKALAQVDFMQRFFNTASIVLISIFGQVISCLMVSYALARIKFPGRKVWFYLIIGSMMLPPIVGLLPVFKLFSSIGWYNTWLPLIVPNFLGAPFFIFLGRQYFCTISYSFDEAAKIDGAGHIKIFLEILLPMVKPVIAVIAIMQFQGTWNDYLTPLVYLKSPKLWTLSIALAQFIVDNNRIEWNLYMAANVVYMIPSLLIFFLGQKYFMQGLGSLNNAGLK